MIPEYDGDGSQLDKKEGRGRGTSPPWPWQRCLWMIGALPRARLCWPCADPRTASVNLSEAGKGAENLQAVLLNAFRDQELVVTPHRGSCAATCVPFLIAASPGRASARTSAGPRYKHAQWWGMFF